MNWLNGFVGFVYLEFLDVLSFQYMLSVSSESSVFKQFPHKKFSIYLYIPTFCLQTPDIQSIKGCIEHTPKSSPIHHLCFFRLLIRYMIQLIDWFSICSNLFRINMKSGNILFLQWKQKVSLEKQTVSTGETMWKLLTFLWNNHITS